MFSSTTTILALALAFAGAPAPESPVPLLPAPPGGAEAPFVALGTGRVSSVVPLDGGCVFQDSMPPSATENWEVQQGRTYAVTLTHVTDCANGGADPSLGVIVKSSNSGNMCLTANRTAAGTYVFVVTLPLTACHTFPIVYCVTGCQENSGLLARRADGGASASHLRAATFGAGCSSPVPDTDCSPPPPASCAAWALDLGGGCGAPAPTLHSTFPVTGQDWLISVKDAPPGVPVVLAANAVPFPPSIAISTCVIHIDPLTALILGPFVTTGIGDFYLPVHVPFLAPSLAFRIQAAVVAPGGPLVTAQLTNGVEAILGSCAPFCTSNADDYAGTGSSGNVLDTHFATVFAAGLEVGVHDASNGSVAPNGLRWSGDAAGLAALEQVLVELPGPSGALSGDGLNPTTSQGAGPLAVQAATLSLNIAFNAAGLLGSQQTGFGSIVYLKMDVPDSLSGLTIAQILAAANQALAGNGLPAGYTYDSLAEFLRILNTSFAGCNLSPTASHRLYPF